jgi:GNAT superfamily N-acetyltransferase
MILEPLRAGDVDRVRPFWLALHAHHQAVAPELAPYVGDAVSWTVRKPQYEGALADGGFGFIATDQGRDIGYLVCARQPMRWNATFARPPMEWEVLSVFVAPERRGCGLGSALLDAAEDVASTSHAAPLMIGVVPMNLRAVALYRARGFAPTWLILTRFRRAAPANRPDRGIQVARLPVEDVASLQSLWLTLHHHHQAVAPGLGPFVGDAASWPIIEGLLKVSARDGLLFVAWRGGRPIGLASAAIYSLQELPTYADTWVMGDRIAETKFLVVAASARGTGAGTALMDAVEQEIAARGVEDHLIGAIASNEEAIRFYRSRGFRPAWLEMSKGWRLTAGAGQSCLNTTVLVTENS